MSSSESEDVPMVDAEEHLPSTSANGHREDEVMENGTVPGEEPNTSEDKSSSEKPQTSNEISTGLPVSEDTKTPDVILTSKNVKESDDTPSAKTTNQEALTNGHKSPVVNGERSQSIPGQDNDSKMNGVNGVNKNSPETTSTPLPKSNGIKRHSRSTSNSVLPSVEGDGYVSPAKHKSAPVEDQVASQAELNRLTKDTARLREALNEVSHKAAQDLLRENWRTFLFDPPDETHVAFILRAGLKNSTPGILSRVIKDDNVFKQPFLEAASTKPALRKKVISTITDEELSSISQDRLEAFIANTIRIAPVNQLVGWLSSGKRLGFEDDDLVSEHDEVVIPNIPPPQYRQQQSYAAAQPQSLHNHHHMNTVMGVSSVAPHVDPLLAEQNRQRELALNRTANQHTNFSPPHPLPIGHGRQLPQSTAGAIGSANQQTGPLVCNDCHHVFSNFPGYHHHITKKPCTKEPPPGGFKWSCPNCLQGFTTKQGNDYHRLKGVCTATDIVPSTNPLSSVPSNDGLPRAAPQAYVPPPVQGPPQSPWVSQRPVIPQSHIRPPPTAGPMQAPLPTVTPGPAPPPQHASPSQQALPPISSIELSVSSPKAKRVPPMPPLHTPTATFHSTSTPPTTRKQAPRKDVRVDPSDLPPDRLAALNRDLAELDRKYEEGVNEMPAEWDTETRNARIVSLKNANSSRKSQVRKNYGVTLRMRDKDKQHRNSKRASMMTNASSSSPTGSAATTPAPMSAPAPISNIARPRFDGLRASNNNSPLGGATLPPTSSFSPINAPAIGFSPVNAPADRNGTSPIPLTPSGFGVLKKQSSGPYDSGSERKRRHDGMEHERRPGSGAGGYTGGIPSGSILNTGLGSSSGNSSGLAMVEMGSEDASAKYSGGGDKRKVQVHVKGVQVDGEGGGEGVNGDGGDRRRGSSELVVIDDSAKEGDGKLGKGKEKEKENETVNEKEKEEEKAKESEN